MGGGEQFLWTGLPAGLLGAGRPADRGVSEDAARDRADRPAAGGEIARPDGFGSSYLCHVVLLSLTGIHGRRSARTSRRPLVRNGMVEWGRVGCGRVDSGPSARGGWDR